MSLTNPAPVCYELTAWALYHTGWFIPPVCWVMGAGALFLSGLLAASMAYRYWTDPQDIFP